MIHALNFEPNYYYHGMDQDHFIQILKEEANDLNERGYDIFWSLNKFKDNRRLKVNLEKNNYIVADFDGIDSGKFFSYWRTNPRPTFIVKTRNGFHAYWKLITPKLIEPEEHNKFIEETLVPLGADPNAKDVSRVLRVPGFRYWQDSKKNRYEDNKIFCEVIYDDGPEWEWEQLKRLFKKSRGSNVGAIHSTNDQPTRQGVSGDNTFWRIANSLEPREALKRLSGTSYVRGERYEFKSEGKITRIIINGKPSNAWIDERGRIGSLHTNGTVPIAGTLVNWLMFPEYGHDMKSVAKIFKEVFNVQD